MLLRSIDWYLSFFFLHDMHSRRKIQSIQIANNVLQQHRTLSSNFLHFREGSYCLKRISFGLNKRNGMECNNNSPVHISVMKFSTASCSMLEVRNQTTEEEELSSLCSYDKQVRMMSLGPRNCRLSRTPSIGKLYGGDGIGWAEASYKLSERKKEMHDLNKCSSYPSNTIASNSQKQAISKSGGHNPMLHDLREPASSLVEHSILNNSKVLIDTEKVGTQLNVPSLKINEEKIDRVNGNHGLDTTAKDAAKTTLTVTKARSAEQSKLRDRLCSIYEDILVIDNPSHAEEVAKMLTINYRHLIHACDTEVQFSTVLTCIMVVPQLQHCT